MHSDLANLLCALRADPGDTVAYLALADWCLEQSAPETQARGEHVRLSLQRGSQPRLATSAREVRDRVKALEKRYRTTWLGALRTFAHRCDFLPGGLVKAELTGGRLARAREQNPAAPTPEEFAWVTALTMRTMTIEDLRWLARILPEGFVASLAVESTSMPGASLVPELARCRWLSGVRSLFVGGPVMPADNGDEWAETLANLAALADLRDLRLPGASLGPKGVGYLAHSQRLRQLEILVLDNNAIGLDGCSALAEASWNVTLRQLSLCGCCLDGQELTRLLQSSFSRRLIRLSLQRNSLDARAAEVLAAWPGLAAVEQLDLEYNPLGDAGVRALVSSPHLSQLRELNLREVDVGDEGVVALATANLPRLERLRLFGNARIGNAGARALCEAQQLPALKYLAIEWLLGTVHCARLSWRVREMLHSRFSLG